MATLSGNAIKDSYQGLLKTSDNAAISASLKTIQDGSGNDTGMSLSATTLRASSLEINSATRSGSTNVLVWDSSSKSVGFRTLPTFETVTTTVTGSTNPTVTIADSAGNSTAIVFNGGSGVDIDQSSNTITFSTPVNQQTTVTGAVSLTSAVNGKTILLDADSIAGGTITLPSVTEGAYLRLLLTTSSNTAFKIQTSNAAASGTVQRFVGKVVVGSTTDDQVAVQRIRNTGNSFDNDTLTIDGDATNTGGIEGDCIELHGVDIGGTVMWLIDGRLTTTNGAPTSIATVGAS